MTASEFHQLLEKWKKHYCSAEEEKLLREMFVSAEKETKDMMISELELLEIHAGNDDVDFESILQQIKDRIKRKSKSKRFTRTAIVYFSKIAAVFIIVLVTGGVLSYFLFGELPVKNGSFYQVKAPYGGRSELILPDGSMVWLNAGSIIRYDDGFNKKNRNLLLEGEGYFKVAKNRNLPFVVNAGNIKIRAIGTQFNVKAYSRDDIIETTLIEGRITLEKEGISGSHDKKIYLKPNQKIIYVKNYRKHNSRSLNKLIAPQTLKTVCVDNDLYIGEKIDPLPDIAWTENKLIFKRAELETMSITLERKYNIVFHFGSDEVKRIRFTGTLEDETLQQVLDVIKLTAPIDYYLEGREVTIFENVTAQKEFKKHLKVKKN